jgi:hypothetical protein
MVGTGRPVHSRTGRPVAFPAVGFPAAGFPAAGFPAAGFPAIRRSRPA